MARRLFSLGQQDEMERQIRGLVTNRPGLTCEVACPEYRRGQRPRRQAQCGRMSRFWEQRHRVSMAARQIVVSNSGRHSILRRVIEASEEAILGIIRGGAATFK